LWQLLRESTTGLITRLAAQLPDSFVSMPATNKKGSVPGSSLSASAQETATGQPSWKKRKMDDTKKKYYAVRRGFETGVYETYAECQAQTTGFKGAERMPARLRALPARFCANTQTDKSFLTREDAEAFVAGKDPTPTDGKKKPPRFYAVAVGNKPGVYTSWPDAQAALGRSNKHKSFGTRAEAEAFVRQYNSQFTTSTINPSANFTTEDSEEEEEDGHPAKKAKSNNAVVAYTDGSALGNGRAGARSGVGVFFGPNDPKFVSSNANRGLSGALLLTSFLPGTSRNPYQARPRPISELN
jgi:ribonuclease HI